MTANRGLVLVAQALLPGLMVLSIAPVTRAIALRKAVPIHVRMLTYVGEHPPDVRTEFSWRVGFEGKRFQLHLTKMIVLTGTMMPLAIDAAVSMYPVQFQLIGEKSAVQHFLSTPPGQLVQVNAYLRIDGISRYLMLDRVTPVPTAAPTGH